MGEPPRGTEGLYRGVVTTETMSEDDPSVPIVCAECNTETRVPLSELADTLSRHNENAHDGEEIAEVDPVLKDRLADLVAADLGLLDEE